MRRTGYAIAVGINVAFWFAVNRWPGWEAVPFLTADTVLVLGWVNVSIATGIAANVAYLAYDEPWFRALGDIVTTAVGLAALMRIWRVFPIDAAAPWPTVARFVLVVAIGGSVIGLIVQATSLARALNQRSAT
jgi:hypothetical protein